MFYLKELHAKGFKIKQIARMTGHDPKTVRKYIKAQELPQYKPRPTRPSKLDPFKPYLLSRIKEGMLNCNVLLDEIRVIGYTGGKTILKDFVAKFRAPRVPEAVLRFETLPGQQAQADWAHFRYQDIDGQWRTVYGFVYVLSYSRYIYLEFTERMDLDTLLQCLLNAFEACGGVPQEVLFDNMKQVVLGRDEQGLVQWHPRFADFAAQVGFRPRACRPRRAQTKGRVERVIRYIRENFWPGRRFVNIADLNEQARAWCAKANRRVHGTTQEVPAEQLALERLQPLPERKRVEHLLGTVRKVSRDGFVSWGGSRYGVPWQWAGSQVVVKDRGSHLEIWTAMGDQCICRHPKSLLAGATIRLPGQYDGLKLDGSTRTSEPLALRVPAPEVEMRPLSAYEAVAGGANG